MEVDEGRLRETVERLARLERAPCSEGEREAAERIAAEFRRNGCDARVEPERVHGSFHWPLGLLALAAAIGGFAALRGRRLLGGLAGAVAAASMWEDLGGGERRPFRRLLPQGLTHNVVAESGDRDAERTLVVLAHHDAARTSLVYDQRGPRLAHELAPWLIARLDRWPPLMGLVIGGPALVAAGALTGRRGVSAAGTLLALGTAGVMADMARNPVVPGANDNLSAVAALVELARLLAERSTAGLRVLLVSTGAEEANQEGMLALGARHFGSLPTATTSFLCFESVGSSELLMIEGEGFLRMREYPEGMKELLDASARAAGVHMRRGLRNTFASDGLIPMRRGYQTATLCSVNEYMVPSNYHQPTDTADRVDYGSVAGAVRIALALVDRLRESAAP